jgi:hypothetical protein
MSDNCLLALPLRIAWPSQSETICFLTVVILVVATERYQQYHQGGFRRKWSTCSTWPEILTRYTDYGAQVPRAEIARLKSEMKPSVAKPEALTKPDPEAIAQGHRLQARIDCYS